LIGQLREMLGPLLTATGSQPAVGVPLPRVETVPASVRQPPARQRPVHQLTVPAVDDNGLGSPVDSEEAWW
jgi:hypothetical protein